ncbi:MAG: DUF4173 domain-containing protein [Anaerolineales bacterium]
MAKYFRPKRLILLSLVLAWVFDFLFWGKAQGISFPIFTGLVLALGFWFASQEGNRPPRSSLLLLIPIIFFSAVTAIRAEGFTVFLGVFYTISLLAILAVTFLGGRWIKYSFSDYFAKLLLLFPSGISVLQASTPKISKKKSPLQSLAPVLRGLLFAIPIVWVLAALLSSADVIFADWLVDFFAFLRIDNLVEYIFRGFYILILGYMLAAAYMFSLNKSKSEELLGAKKPLFSPILGFTEAVTILASVNVLFAAFVVVQFQYFFGGATNIFSTSSGFTYAEYARQGFAELVVVAVLSLFLFIALSTIVQRGKAKQQTWFSGLGIALMLLVSVILVSAFQRLLLYESVFGFTRMRTFPHVFMIWLGLLLAAVVVLELLNRRRAFALATLAAALGFSATLPILNVDAFIVRANLQRYQTSGDIDIGYLASLSADAVPPLVAEYLHAKVAGNDDRTQIAAGALACHASQHYDYAGNTAWQSWHYSRNAAQQLWAQISSNAIFEQILLEADGESRYVPAVMINGEEFSCFPMSWD